MAALNAEYMAQFRAAKPSVPKVLRWIEALRSGEYKQTKNVLVGPGDNCFCCLGVAAKIGGDEDSIADDSTHAAAEFLIGDLGFENMGAFYDANRGDWCDWYDPFATANDTDGWSFAQIANWLEQAINLQRTIDLLEALPDERFNMKWWRKDAFGVARGFMPDAELQHDCGTAACIAGWAAIFSPDIEEHTRMRGREALGLNYAQSGQLFEPVRMAERTRLEAIEVLKVFRDTGEIQWS